MENYDPFLAKLYHYDFLLEKALEKRSERRSVLFGEKRQIVPVQHRNVPTSYPIYANSPQYQSRNPHQQYHQPYPNQHYQQPPWNNYNRHPYQNNFNHHNSPYGNGYNGYSRGHHPPSPLVHHSHMYTSQHYPLGVPSRHSSRGPSMTHHERNSQFFSDDNRSLRSESYHDTSTSSMETSSKIEPIFSVFQTFLALRERTSSDDTSEAPTIPITVPANAVESTAPAVEDGPVPETSSAAAISQPPGQPIDQSATDSAVDGENSLVDPVKTELDDSYEDEEGADEDASSTVSQQSRITPDDAEQNIIVVLEKGPLENPAEEEMISPTEAAPRSSDPIEAPSSSTRTSAVEQPKPIATVAHENLARMNPIDSTEIAALEDGLQPDPPNPIALVGHENLSQLDSTDSTEIGALEDISQTVPPIPSSMESTAVVPISPQMDDDSIDDEEFIDQTAANSTMDLSVFNDIDFDMPELREIQESNTSIINSVEMFPLDSTEQTISDLSESISDPPEDESVRVTSPIPPINPEDTEMDDIPTTSTSVTIPTSADEHIPPVKPKRSYIRGGTKPSDDPKETTAKRQRGGNTDPTTSRRAPRKSRINPGSSAESSASLNESAKESPQPRVNAQQEKLAGALRDTLARGRKTGEPGISSSIEKTKSIEEERSCKTKKHNDLKEEKEDDSMIFKEPETPTNTYSEVKKLLSRREEPRKMDDSANDDLIRFEDDSRILRTSDTPNSSFVNVKKASGKRGRRSKMDDGAKEVTEEDTEILRISEDPINSTPGVKKTSEKRGRLVKMMDDEGIQVETKKLRISKTPATSKINVNYASGKRETPSRKDTPNSTADANKPIRKRGRPKKIVDLDLGSPDHMKDAAFAEKQDKKKKARRQTKQQISDVSESDTEDSEVHADTVNSKMPSAIPEDTEMSEVPSTSMDLHTSTNPQISSGRVKRKSTYINRKPRETKSSDDPEKQSEEKLENSDAPTRIIRQSARKSRKVLVDKISPDDASTSLNKSVNALPSHDGIQTELEEDNSPRKIHKDHFKNFSPDKIAVQRARSLENRSKNNGQKNAEEKPERPNRRMSAVVMDDIDPDDNMDLEMIETSNLSSSSSCKVKRKQTRRKSNSSDDDLYEPSDTVIRKMGHRLKNTVKKGAEEKLEHSKRRKSRVATDDADDFDQMDFETTETTIASKSNRKSTMKSRKDSETASTWNNSVNALPSSRDNIPQQPQLQKSSKKLREDHSTSPEKNTDLRTRTLERRSRKTAEEKEGQKSADDKPERKRGKSPIGQDNTDSVDVWSVRSIDFDTTETINVTVGEVLRRCQLPELFNLDMLKSIYCNESSQHDAFLQFIKKNKIEITRIWAEENNQTRISHLFEEDAARLSKDFSFLTRSYLKPVDLATMISAAAGNQIDDFVSCINDIKKYLLRAKEIVEYTGSYRHKTAKEFNLETHGLGPPITAVIIESIIEALDALMSNRKDITAKDISDPLEFELGDKVTEGIENDLFVEDKLEKNIVGEITPRLNKSIPIEVTIGEIRRRVHGPEKFTLGSVYTYINTAPSKQVVVRNLLYDARIDLTHKRRKDVEKQRSAWSSLTEKEAVALATEMANSLKSIIINDSRLEKKTAEWLRLITSTLYDAMHRIGLNSTENVIKTNFDRIILQYSLVTHNFGQLYYKLVLKWIAPKKKRNRSERIDSAEL